MVSNSGEASNQFSHLCFSAAFSECLWRYKHSVSRHSGKYVQLLSKVMLVEEYNLNGK